MMNNAHRRLLILAALTVASACSTSSPALGPIASPHTEPQSSIASHGGYAPIVVPHEIVFASIHSKRRKGRVMNFSGPYAVFVDACSTYGIAYMDGPYKGHAGRHHFEVYPLAPGRCKFQFINGGTTTLNVIVR
jgi:hypothetical protein